MSYVWAISMRARQKEHHALHGNGPIANPIPQPVPVPPGEEHRCMYCSLPGLPEPATLIVAGRSSWERSAYLCEPCLDSLRSSGVRRELWVAPPVFYVEGNEEEAVHITDRTYQHARHWLIMEEEVEGFHERRFHGFHNTHLCERYKAIVRIYEDHLLAHSVLTPMVVQREMCGHAPLQRMHYVVEYPVRGAESLPPSPPHSPGLA